MNVGFIGLGNLGAKLSGSLLRNHINLMVFDIDEDACAKAKKLGARVAESIAHLAQHCETIITCLPSPHISAQIIEGPGGILSAGIAGKLWLEMSTTDHGEVLRLGKIVESEGGTMLDSPVSGGCHRADTGNIAIFAGGNRKTFERALPLLKIMGRRILHTGPLGSATTLKLITNYLASAHLAALGEAWALAAKSGMDMAKTYEAIKISSGNSFVHETESQVILNGSYDIGFTMELVEKDVGLFDKLAVQHGIETEIAPLLIQIFQDGRRKYGSQAWSSSIVRRQEQACDTTFRANGFPPLLVDEEPEAEGYEVGMAD